MDVGLFLGGAALAGVVGAVTGAGINYGIQGARKLRHRHQEQAQQIAEQQPTYYSQQPYYNYPPQSHYYPPQPSGYSRGRYASRYGYY
jgi:hypothetical protein